MMDLLFMKLDPSALDDVNLFNYFVGLNNCGNPNIKTQIESEFDYPGIVAFYKPRINKILDDANIPTTIHLGGPNVYLGEYDMAKNSFPFTNGRPAAFMKQQIFSLDGLKLDDNRIGMSANCRELEGRLPKRFGPTPLIEPTYSVKFPNVTFSALKMDEPAARAFVESMPNGGREVGLTIDIQVLDEVPQRIQVRGERTEIRFSGKVVKVSAINLRTNKEIGTVYP